MKSGWHVNACRYSDRIAANGFHSLLEVLAVAGGTILDAGTVVVDGVHRFVQKFGYLRRVFDTQADKGEDTDVGGEPVLLFGMNLQLGLEQGVEVVDEGGEEVQEDGIEILIAPSPSARSTW